MPTFTLNLNQKDTEIEVTRQGKRLRITRDGKTHHAHIVHQDGAAFILEVETSDGGRKRIRAAGHIGQNGKRQIWVNGRTLTYQRRQKQVGGVASAGAGALSANIPAVVSQILVAEGDEVSTGDKLLLLESMKMVIPIQAPYDGVVAAINCDTGDSVQAGIPLIELEELES